MQQQRKGPEPRKSRRAWRSTLLPEALIVVCSLVLVWFFRSILGEAQRSDIALGTLLPMFLAVVGFVVAAGVLVLTQASRSATRLKGPSQRLIVSMQRAQRGDLAHRVHLRHGDELRDVAAEFNRLLDWLNANPPEGAKTGTDLVEVDATGLASFDPEDPQHVELEELVDEEVVECEPILDDDEDEDEPVEPRVIGVEEVEELGVRSDA